MTGRELLVRAGWSVGRRVVIEDQLAALRAEGFEVWRDLESFLATYCFLAPESAGGSRSLWIDPVRAVAGSDPAWVFRYERALGVRLAPVGGYSHMTVMVGADSALYGGFDAQFGRLGSSIEDVVDGLLCSTPPVCLSMVLK